MDHIEQIYSMLHRIQNDLNDIKVELEVIQRTGMTQHRSHQVKHSAAGGGVGAILMAIILGGWELFSKK